MGARNVKLNQGRATKSVKPRQKTTLPKNTKTPLKTAGNEAVSKHEDGKDQIPSQNKGDDITKSNKKHGEGRITPK